MASRDDRKPPLEHGGRRDVRPYLWATGACALTTLVTAPMVDHFDLANIVMLFLLNVVLVAVRFGRGPAVLATVLGVGAFDFFFVAPRFTFAVRDFQYLITFAVMLAVGLIASHLTAGLRFQADVAAKREARARALYEFARKLSGMLDTGSITAVTQEVVRDSIHVRAALLLPDDEGRLCLPHLGALDQDAAQWAYEHAQATGLGTTHMPGSRFHFLPLVATAHARGVLALESESGGWTLSSEQRQQLDTYAALAAIALERVHYVEVARDALVRMESERLRNSLLAALSHDLRTPLTSLVGLSESLALSRPALAHHQASLAFALRDEAMRMSSLVSNLLHMARIQSGEIRLNLQWQPIEEVVGSSIRACGPVLARHEVRTHIPGGLPLVQFDAILMERVLCNLLENAAKYAPPDSTIDVDAFTRETSMVVAVCDNGPGLPDGMEEAVFEKFTRGVRESATPGVGLGLAICRAIVEAHGGRISARNSVDRGACITFTLPLGSPPSSPEMEEPVTNPDMPLP